MAASSVTGTGLGDSFGKKKCKNHCGGCGCKCVDEPPKRPPYKSGCYRRVNAGQRVAYKAGNGAIGIKVC